MAIDARFTGVLLVRSGDMLDLTILRRAFPLTTDVWCHRRGCGKVACDPSRELGGIALRRRWWFCARRY